MEGSSSRKQKSFWRDTSGNGTRYGLFLFFLIAFVSFVYALYYMICTRNNIVDTLVGIIGLLFTVFIAITQDKQMLKLKEIGTETRETTETLQTNALRQRRIRNFFKKTNPKNKYNLFFNVNYDKRTLPVVSVADSYAMHVISNLIGVNDLDLKPVQKNTEEDFDDNDLKCNSIFICCVNIALERFIDSYILSNSTALPCWFDDVPSDSSYSISRIIKINDDNIIPNKLISPSEEDYVKASKLAPNVPYVDRPLHRDYGIVARLSQGDYKYIIIAGLHGFGTWIMSSFLNYLINGNTNNEIEKYNPIFFGESDFIAVVSGYFDSTKLYVDASTITILDGLIWMKVAQEWTKVNLSSYQEQNV